jgi:hypothetical protein
MGIAKNPSGRINGFNHDLILESLNKNIEPKPIETKIAISPKDSITSI